MERDWRRRHHPVQTPTKKQDSLALKKGLYMKSDVFNRHGKSEKVTIAKDFQDRLQFNGLFPNMDILIKNVTSKDTDTYWCVYKKVEVSSPVTENGEGSILLVVTEPQTDSSVPQCDQSNNNLILVLVVIGAAVLLGIIICFLVWIFRKTKSLRSAKKPRRVATNDVYEDMRGTIRG
ncbi:hypothetical protein F7725_003523 [Dissostichus mawsoni]|uniref:Immunoglobulin V-set domain-containing protein n=1 Tax=Dissostichus mawsoni TaxID=36200 RepID=A0A7J5YAL0_DISMA|nr:hypothetical protein F7725_003523 [Dissostichus mawsoni]